MSEEQIESDRALAHKRGIHEALNGKEVEKAISFKDDAIIITREGTFGSRDEVKRRLPCSPQTSRSCLYQRLHRNRDA